MTASVLDPIYHERLLRDIDNIADDANIDPSFIHTSITEVCTEDQIAWVRGFKGWHTKGRYGLVMVGQGDPSDKMRAMAGALLRNFVRVRVTTLQSIYDELNDPELVEISCLFVTNFYDHNAHANSMPGWKVAQLYDLLLNRSAKKKQTVLYVSDIGKLKIDYGGSIAEMITKHYPACKV